MEDQRLCMDRISSLPSSLTESILCLLPIKEAARTSILARTWRDSWITIPKLEFIEKDFAIPTEENQLSVRDRNIVSPQMRKIFSIIFQVLLVHRGPIDEFTLSMKSCKSCVEIDQIILHLSRNHTLKKLKLDLRLYSNAEYRIPRSIFTLHHLTHLYLRHCHFKFDPTKMKGFGRLTSLCMVDIITSSNALLNLLSNSPLLKSVAVMTCNFYNDGDSTIFDLFKCLRVVEHLTICNMTRQCFVYDVPRPRELPTSLVNLKSFCVQDMMWFEQGIEDKYGLPFLLFFLRCSTKLEKIELRICDFPCSDESALASVALQDHSDIWLEHLNELVIEHFTNLKPEIEFVKLILAKSPMLKKVNIYHRVFKDEEVQMVEVLLRSPRVSPAVNIMVEPYLDNYHERWVEMTIDH